MNKTLYNTKRPGLLEGQSRFVPGLFLHSGQIEASVLIKLFHKKWSGNSNIATRGLQGGV